MSRIILNASQSRRTQSSRFIVAVATTVGGLNWVVMLEVSEAFETVTPEEESDRPGTLNGPRVTTGAGEVLVKQMSFLFVQELPVNE